MNKLIQLAATAAVLLACATAQNFSGLTPDLSKATFAGPAISTFKSNLMFTEPTLISAEIVNDGRTLHLYKRTPASGIYLCNAAGSGCTPEMSAQDYREVYHVTNDRLQFITVERKLPVTRTNVAVTTEYEYPKP